MKDFIGNELEINNYIAFSRNPYADLMIGKIVGFTPKGLKIIKKNKDGSWGEYEPYENKSGGYEIVFPYQCVKIEYKEKAG